MEIEPTEAAWLQNFWKHTDRMRRKAQRAVNRGRRPDFGFADGELSQPIRNARYEAAVAARMNGAAYNE